MPNISQISTSPTDGRTDTGPLLREHIIETRCWRSGPPLLVFLIKIEDYKAFYSARKGLRLGGLSSISQQNRPFPSFETGARGI